MRFFLALCFALSAVNIVGCHEQTRDPYIYSTTPSMVDSSTVSQEPLTAGTSGSITPSPTVNADGSITTLPDASVDSCVVGSNSSCLVVPNDSGSNPVSDSGIAPVTGNNFVYTGDYQEWLLGNDSYAPGQVISIVDYNHTGYRQARCFECHGVGMPNEPINHDPRMQYWSWSCAQGFPGGICHGHGINGSLLYNHNNDPFFTGCTKEGCHYQNNALKQFENHGFMRAPDPFCNACHDYNWSSWPVVDLTQNL